MIGTKRRGIAAAGLAAALAWTVACGGGLHIPPVVDPQQPPVVQPPAEQPIRAIGIVALQAGTRKIVEGLAARMVLADDSGKLFECAASPCKTDAAGYVMFDRVPIGSVVAVELAGDGWLPSRYVFTLTAETENNLELPVASQAPPAAPAATDSELHNVQANFCNIETPGPTAPGQPMFTIFYISLGQEDRAAWLKAQAAHGSTHFVLSPKAGYPGAAFPDKDLTVQPDVFAAYIREVLAAPGANGKGFTPILILDDGDYGIRERMSKLSPELKAALGADADRVLVVPGWELVAASRATSADLSFTLKQLRRDGWAHIWVHLSPGRASGSSNPGEADDPWRRWSWPVRNEDGSLVYEDDGNGGQRIKYQDGEGIGDGAEADKAAHPDELGHWGGAEKPFWEMEGGQFAEGLLYQSAAVRGDDDLCDAAKADCWKNRWEDVVPRLGQGMNGWKVLGGGSQVGLVYFEGPAYYFFRGQVDSAFAIRIAEQARAMCDKYRVTCGYGNGIPGKR